MREVKLGDRLIGDGHPTFVIAEMACSHDGLVEKAQKEAIDYDGSSN